VRFGAALKHDVELCIATNADGPAKHRTNSLRSLFAMNCVDVAVSASVQAAVNLLSNLDHLKLRLSVVHGNPYKILVHLPKSVTNLVHLHSGEVLVLDRKVKPLIEVFCQAA
jgi:hypothetical protein